MLKKVRVSNEATAPLLTRIFATMTRRNQLGQAFARYTIGHFLNQPDNPTAFALPRFEAMDEPQVDDVHQHLFQACRPRLSGCPDPQPACPKSTGNSRVRSTRLGRVPVPLWCSFLSHTHNDYGTATLVYHGYFERVRQSNG